MRPFRSGLASSPSPTCTTRSPRTARTAPPCRDVAVAHLMSEAGRTLDADVVAAMLGLIRLDAGAA